MRGYPRRYVIFDTETKSTGSTDRDWDREQWLRLGVAKVYDRRRRGDPPCVYHTFRTQDEFFAILDAMPCSDEKIFVFAHNISFDTRIVDWFGEIGDGRYDLYPPKHMKGAWRYKKELLVVDSSPVIIRLFRPDGQQFFLLDNFNWFPDRLSKLAAWTEIKPVPKPARNAPDDAWETRCRADVDILDALLRRTWCFLKNLDLPSFEVTPASEAAMIYRKTYERKRIIRNMESDALAFARKSYYAGLVECYSIGRIDRPTHQVDVTGLYPRVMVDGLYPVELEAHGNFRGKGVEDLDLDPRSSIAEVFIRSDTTPYPVRVKEGVCRVTGEVRTILAGPELERAWTAGDVVRVGRWQSYRCDNLFEEYVDRYHGLRKAAQAKGDKLIAYVCKSLLNSLHGKFGQRDGQWRNTKIRTPIGSYGGGAVGGRKAGPRVSYRDFNGWRFYKDMDKEHPNAFVPIAAFCSSYAKVLMEEVKDRIGVDNVHYQCVDTLFLTGDGLGQLQLLGVVDTGELGHFRLEGSHDWIQVWGPNQVTGPGWAKVSGVKLDSKQVGTNLWEVEEWQSLDAALNREGWHTVRTRKVLRAPSRHYARRLVGPDGRTIPYKVKAWGKTLADLEKTNLRDLLAGGE